jgi:hypothetical protein
MEEPELDGARPRPWTQVSEQNLARHAFFELRRGIRRREWWADRLAQPQPVERSPA